MNLQDRFPSASRPSPTQRLLGLDHKVGATIVALGDPPPRRVITERALRPLIDLPVEEQERSVAELVGRMKHYGPEEIARVGL